MADEMFDNDFEENAEPEESQKVAETAKKETKTGLPATVGSKEESDKLKKELARMEMPEGTDSWLRYWKIEVVDGKKMIVAYTQPFVVKSLTPEEKAKREAEEKAKREEYNKEGASFGLEPMKSEESIGDYRSKIAEARKKRNEADKLKAQKERAKAKLDKIREQEAELEEKKKELEAIAG
ncbi:MAG: hypothetical protein ACE5RP_00080 [Nitrosopumilus sp.]